MLNIRVLFGDDFPEKLIGSAYSLSELGLSNFAWKHEDAIKVIEHCYRKKMGILGGDVLCLRDSIIEFTYDSWYLNRNEKEWDVYVGESRKKALDYMASYESSNKKSGAVFLYKIVTGKANFF